MEKIQIDQRTMLALADQYEHHNVNWLRIAPESVQEYEDFRERYATLRADGLLNVRPGTEKSLLCQFTDKGYAEYAPQIKALRVLSA